MSLENKALALATAVGGDIRQLLSTVGDITQLSTTDKTNLVNALNELQAGISAVDITALIDDAAGAGVLNKAWSADKLVAAIQAAKDEIVAGAPTTMDTLAEIATYLAANDGAINSMLTELNNRVRFDAPQTLTESEQLQACTNIGVDNNLIDLVALYTTNKGVVEPPAGGEGSSPGVTGNDFAFTDGEADGSSPGVTGNDINF